MKKLEDSSIVICGIVRDAENGLKRNIPVIKDLCRHAKDYIVVLFENDSKDGTKAYLRQWQKEDGKVVAVMKDATAPSPIPRKMEDGRNPFFCKERIGKMVYLRNQYMQYIQEHDITADYLIVVDLDVAQLYLDGIISSFSTSVEWDSITAFGYSTSPKLKRRYHDGFALVEYGKEAEPKTESGIKELCEKYGEFSSPEPVRVYSAFGGLAIYRFEAVRGLKYQLLGNDDPRVECKCEHTSICAQMKDRGFDRVYINPKMKLHYQSLSLSLIWKTFVRHLKRN